MMTDLKAKNMIKNDDLKAKNMIRKQNENVF